LWVADVSFQQIKAVKAVPLWKRYVYRRTKVYLSSFFADINRKIARFFDGGIPGLCRVTIKEKVDPNKVGNRLLPRRSKVRTWRRSTTQFIERYS
jgi:hypothetical protein